MKFYLTSAIFAQNKHDLEGPFFENFHHARLEITVHTAGHSPIWGHYPGHHAVVLQEYDGFIPSAGAPGWLQWLKPGEVRHFRINRSSLRMEMSRHLRTYRGIAPVCFFVLFWCTYLLTTQLTE